jgi:hypothetical protein
VKDQHDRYDKRQYRPLTERQREFVLAFIENGGNATQAAAYAYCCSTPNSAAVTGSRLLRNVNIQREIEAAMAQAGLSIGALVHKFTDRINAEPTLLGRLKGLEMLFKLLGL